MDGSVDQEEIGGESWIMKVWQGIQSARSSKGEFRASRSRFQE